MKVQWEQMHSSTMKAADFSGPGWLTRCVRISQFNGRGIKKNISNASSKQVVMHQKWNHLTAILGGLFSYWLWLTVFFWDSFILLILHPYCWWFRNPIRNHLGCFFNPINTGRNYQDFFHQHFRSVDFSVKPKVSASHFPWDLPGWQSYSPTIHFFGGIYKPTYQ